MKSVSILEQNLGYVDCNICGAGYNSIAVTLFEDNSFTVTRNSKCYGNVTEEFVDAIFLREFLERNWFMVATKYARETMTSFVKDLKAGRFTYDQATGQVWFDEPVDTSAPIQAPEVTIQVPSPGTSWHNMVEWTALTASFRTLNDTFLGDRTLS